MPDALVAHPAHGEHHGPGPNTVFGFWLYLMTDCILFATVFAAFAVARHQFAGGPAGRDIFDLKYVAVETCLLLVSSCTYGFAMLAAFRHNRSQLMLWLGITFLLGLGFIGMEIREFAHLVSEGDGPDRSAFLSAFFTLVGTHGFHVTCGLIWMMVLMLQIAIKQPRLDGVYMNRLMCLSLFWHFLDIVWICVFSFVYLMGAN